MAQELQELAKTPWTREQWIDQVRCVQDDCDDTPNADEEEHGTSLDSIMRKAAMIRKTAIGLVAKKIKAQNDLLRRDVILLRVVASWMRRFFPPYMMTCRSG